MLYRMFIDREAMEKTTIPGIRPLRYMREYRANVSKGVNRVPVYLAIASVILFYRTRASAMLSTHFLAVEMRSKMKRTPCLAASRFAARHQLPCHACTHTYTETYYNLARCVSRQCGSRPAGGTEVFRLLQTQCHYPHRRQGMG